MPSRYVFNTQSPVTVMHKIIGGLYVGTVEDAEMVRGNGFSILGACKEPLHRRHARLRGADRDGYIGRAIPKDEPEYLCAERNHALYCNLVDAKDPKYISDKIIDRALKFINDERDKGRKVLIVCNNAESRSPSIAFMWLIYNEGEKWREIGDYESAVSFFKKYYYSRYNPGNGFSEYVRNFWEAYKNGEK